MYPWTGDKSFLAFYIPVAKWHYYYFFHVAKWLNMRSVKIGNPMGPSIRIQVGQPGTCIQLPCHVASSGWPQNQLEKSLSALISSFNNFFCGSLNLWTNLFLWVCTVWPTWWTALGLHSVAHIGMRGRVRVGWDIHLCRFRNCICIFPWIIVWRFMTRAWPG